MADSRESKVLVGTASWTDPTLIKCKRFYPAEAKTPQERLRFYASQFPIVEVDSSFYALPSIDNAISWARTTPEEFVFDVKAFRLFTLHQTPVKSLPPEVRPAAEPAANRQGNVYYADLPSEVRDDLWQRFKDGVGPLRQAGKLGYVLLQLPPWALKRKSNIEHLMECADRLDGCTVAVEFRHVSWMSELEQRATVATLREQNLALVIVDEPQGFYSSLPTVWEVTSPDLAVVRFHGRNREMWMKKGLKSSAERFDYLYSDEELQEFVEPVKRLTERTKKVHALFNNCMEDKAQRNARQFAEMLAAESGL